VANNYTHTPTYIKEHIFKDREKQYNDIMVRDDCNTFDEFCSGETKNYDEVIIAYHMSRYNKFGKTTYVIRRNKFDYLKNIKLKFNGDMLIVPFKEFIISVPDNTIASQPANIFVSIEDISDTKNIRLDHVISSYIKDKGASRILRILAIIGNKTQMYMQIPIVDNIPVCDSSNYIIESARGVGQDGDTYNSIINIVVNFSAYLTIKDPDVQVILGIKYKMPGKEKKRNAILKKMQRNGYDHYDVGRIYDERVIYENSHGASGKSIKKKFMVHAHIRSQWYGVKTDENPNGTHQKNIIIESFEKGAGNAQEHMVLVGGKEI